MTTKTIIQTKRGELKKRREAYKLFPELAILASSEKEQWTEVEIITLKQYAKDLAFQKAWDDNPQAASLEYIEEQANQHLNNEFNNLTEFVEIQEKKIIVGISADKVDDFAVDKAYMFLLEIEDFSPGIKIEFEQGTPNEKQIVG